MGYRYLLKEFRSRPIIICINVRIKFIQVIVQYFFRTFGQQEMTSNIAMHYLDSPTASGSDLLVQQQIPSTFTISLCSSESRHCSAIKFLNAYHLTKSYLIYNDTDVGNHASAYIRLVLARESLTPWRHWFRKSIKFFKLRWAIYDAAKNKHARIMKYFVGWSKIKTSYVRPNFRMVFLK